ncbi:MAG: flavodoxin domain-containing protein [Candidatus Freyrarchaeum guaymaensis]
MNVCIVYDTKREKRATRQIVEWMAEELGAVEDLRVSVKRPWEVESFHYDLFVVGSPIYYEKPLKSVVEFLASNREKLKQKKVAVFILCWAEKLGKLAKRYVKKRYLKPLEREVSDSLIMSGVFRGWLHNPDTKQRELCTNWIREVVEKAKKDG